MANERNSRYIQIKMLVCVRDRRLKQRKLTKEKILMFKNRGTKGKSIEEPTKVCCINIRMAARMYVWARARVLQTTDKEKCHEFITNSCFSHNLCIFIFLFSIYCCWMKKLLLWWVSSWLVFGCWFLVLRFVSSLSNFFQFHLKPDANRLRHQQSRATRYWEPISFSSSISSFVYYSVFERLCIVF